MPEGFPFPFPFLPGGGKDEPHTSIEELLRQLDEKRRERGAPPIVDRPEDHQEATIPNVANPDDIVDIGPDSGVVMPGSSAPVPMPDPGSVNWGEFGFTRERGQPILVNKRTGKKIGRIVPRAFGGQRAPVPPALLQLQQRPSRPSASRARERARPRGLQGFPSVLRAIGSLGAARIPLPSRSRTSGGAPARLSFRGPRTTTPRPLETETTPGGFEIPYPYPQKIGKPREAPENERARARILLDKIRRGESIFPQPDVNPTIPPYRPPRRTASPAPAPVELPIPSPEMRPVPSPTFPTPGPVTQPSPLPLPSPPVPRIPTPRPPSRVPKAAPARRKPALRTAQGLGVASILRPILRRRDQGYTSLLSRFTAPFDPVNPLNRLGDPIAPPPATSVPPRIAEPDLQPLTPDNALRLSLNPQATGTRRKQKEDECNCEEQKEARRRPSSKIAAVKAYRRRMSQNSLDNLRS